RASRTSFVLATALALIITFAAARNPLHGQTSGGGQQRATAPGGRTPTIEERTAGLSKLDGFFPMYWDERSGTVWLEIPRFDAEVLYATGLSSGLGSNDIGLDRGQEGGGHIIIFRRVGPKVLMVEPNVSFRSTSATPPSGRLSKTRSRPPSSGDS